MKGYKGFSKGLVCRGKQYEENTIYEEEKAVICQSGMHFCENPMDVLDHYGFVDDEGNMNEFAEVEALDECFTDDNKKYCTKKLKIGATLTLSGFIKACVDFLIEKTTVEIADAKVNDNDEAVISSKARYAKMASSGDSAQMASSGYSAQMASSGDSAQMASSGYSAKMASSGDSAKMASSGDSAKMASSGDSAQMASSGYSAQMASSGYSSKMDSTGQDSVICCAGRNGMAKAKKGSWITLSEWEYSDKKERWIPICVKTEFVDGDRIKENTWYKIKNGEFIEV